MKTLRNKFKRITFVRPLYKNVRPKSTLVQLDSVYKLDGHDFKVRRNFVSNTIKNASKYNDNLALPGVCESEVKEFENKGFKMIHNVYTSENEDRRKANKEIQVMKIFIANTVPDTWLRVFPLPKLPTESWCSVIIRCFVCQLGLATFLTVWTIVWVFIIQYFEGPNEINVPKEFEYDQSQLVINLATELRQETKICIPSSPSMSLHEDSHKKIETNLSFHITPISPRWRDAIEKRIQEERFLTFEAIKRGARVHPGQFWDLPGTFLFTVYVMTALGFGAPVPHTIWGRSCALIYAVLAVPMHIYLMVNSSTCIVRNVSAHNCSLRKQMKSRSILEEGMLRDNAKESPNCSRNSEMIKTSNYGAFRRKIKRIITVFCACRCVPLATVMYYTCGAIAFGVLRDRPAVDVVMFPIEFTTTGGLERINGHVRFLYGFYVEGAMVLIACILATLRRRSNNKVNLIADKYRLFKVDN